MPVLKTISLDQLKNALILLICRLGIGLIFLLLLTTKANSQRSFTISQSNSYQDKLLAQADPAQELFDRATEQLNNEDVKQAIALWLEAAELSRQQGDSHGEALSLGNIGLAYEILSDYPQAVNYFEQTLAIAKKLNDRQLIAGIQGNLGNNYLRIGSYPQAISAYDESLALWQALNNQAAVGQVLRGMGNVQIALGNYEKAQTLHQQALTI